MINHIVELIDSGRVVGLYLGRSESGPRALGNRTILADPRHPNMQSFINQRVKGREWLRPLAPIVLLDAANTFFDIDGPAPFMQFAADVRPEYRSSLPAITHVDGTARLQTGDEENTPFLYALLKAFEAKTGYPILLNTSLNGPGQPLVESLRDALECQPPCCLLFHESSGDSPDGRSTVNSVPFPFSLETEIEPLCASTILRQM